jgi:hypothetical protein
MSRPAASLLLAIAAASLVAAPAFAADPSPAASGSAAHAPAAAVEDDCYTLEPGTAGEVEHPTEPAAIVLRMFHGGGFVPQAIAFIETPRFTLYGNDVAVFRAPVPPDADIAAPRPAFQCLQLTPEQVDELLTFALEEGGLADAATDYPNPNITDVGSTVFTIDAGGVDKTVSVFALGFDMAPEDQLEDRAGFVTLAALLADFGASVEGEVDMAVPAYAAMLEADASDVPQEPTAWPWADVLPEDFVLGDPSTEVILAADQVSAVTTVPNGGQAFIPVTSPEGEPLVLSVRPLLP